MIRQGMSVVLLCGILIGCGGSEDLPPLAAIQGTVSYNGKPLSEGDVTFYPKDGRSAVGKIKDGKIVEVTTFKPNDGAPLGELKVTVTALPPPKDPSDMTPRTSLVPAKYADVKTSNLTVNVQAKGKNEFDLKLAD